MAAIQDGLTAEDTNEIEKTTKLVNLIADKIGGDKIGVVSLVEQLADDLHVQFIWSLWAATENVEDYFF